VTTAQAVVDSHLHFWDTDRFDYPWLQGFTKLNRPFLPADLDVGDVLIEGLIFVQANPVWEAVDQETAWVQDLRRRDARIQGLVAGVPLDRGAAAVEASLQRLSHEPGVAGVRQLIQDEDEGFALQPPFVEAVQLSGQLGLAVDLCVRSHQIAEVTRLAELCPEATFVLDHLGKPDIAAGQWTDWLHDIQAMAQLDNVRCKLSGLTTEAGEGISGTNKIRPYLQAAVDAFGPDRCMFGSDWPNAGLQISYAGWVSLVLDSVSDLGARERDRVMRGTALEVYARAWHPR